MVLNAIGWVTVDVRNTVDVIGIPRTSLRTSRIDVSVTGSIVSVVVQSIVLTTVKHGSVVVLVTGGSGISKVEGCTVVHSTTVKVSVIGGISMKEVTPGGILVSVMGVSCSVLVTGMVVISCFTSIEQISFIIVGSSRIGRR